MDKQDECPFQSDFKKQMLDVHAHLCKAAAFVWFPMIWVAEQVSGTADLREWLARPNQDSE